MSFKFAFARVVFTREELDRLARLRIAFVRFAFCMLILRKSRSDKSSSERSQLSRDGTGGWSVSSCGSSTRETTSARVSSSFSLPVSLSEVWRLLSTPFSGLSPSVWGGFSSTSS